MDRLVRRLNTFPDSHANDMEQLRRVLGQGETETVLRIAHMLGLAKIQGMAQDLEAALCEGRLESVEPLVATIEAASIAIIAAIRNHPAREFPAAGVTG